MGKQVEIISVTPQNIEAYGLFCVKDKSNPGYASKRQWFLQEYPRGLRLKILQSGSGRQLGFIEYATAEKAWRPVEAPGYLFIHCMYIYKKEDRGKGYASMLLQDCVEDARRGGKAGVAVMSSEGVWMAGQRVFLKNGFRRADKKGRFELLYLPLAAGTPPRLKNWESPPSAANVGWQLLYANQCPWHQKCAEELRAYSEETGIGLQIATLAEAAAAQAAPGGFGVFALLKDGEVVADHYISKTRFKNILQKLS